MISSLKLGFDLVEGHTCALGDQHAIGALRPDRTGVLGHVVIEDDFGWFEIKLLQGFPEVGRLVTVVVVC